MSQRRKKKLESLKIRNNKYTQRANEQKRKELSKTTTTNKRGRQVDKKKGLSNLPKEGQRALVLKQGGHGMGSDYKKSEKQAFNKAKKWQKSDEKKKKTMEYKKGKDNLKVKKKKTSGGGGGESSGSSKWIRTSKGTLARRGSVSARRAENKEAARKRAQEMARKKKKGY